MYGVTDCASASMMVFFESVLLPEKLPANLAFCLEALLASPPFRHARPDLVRLSGDQLRVSYLEVDDGGPTD